MDEIGFSPGLERILESLDGIRRPQAEVMLSNVLYFRESVGVEDQETIIKRFSETRNYIFNLKKILEDFLEKKEARVIITQPYLTLIDSYLAKLDMLSPEENIKSYFPAYIQEQIRKDLLELQKEKYIEVMEHIKIKNHIDRLTRKNANNNTQ